MLKAKMVSKKGDKFIREYKGYKIYRVSRGKSKGLLYANRKDTSFGFLYSDDPMRDILNEINRRTEKLRKVS